MREGLRKIQKEGVLMQMDIIAQRFVTHALSYQHAETVKPDCVGNVAREDRVLDDLSRPGRKSTGRWLWREVEKYDLTRRFLPKK